MRSTDKACHETISRMVKYLLRRTYLLYHSVLHDYDAVSQGHGLGLVVGNIDEGGIYALAKLDYLRTHLVSELCIQVGEGLIHEQHLGLTDYSTAYGHTLALASGKGLGLSLQILRDAKYLRSLIHPPVYLLSAHLSELKGKFHIAPYGHVGIEGIALEYHGNVPVLGGHIIHELSAYIQLSPGYLLQARHHTEGRGLSAARRPYEHHKFSVLYIEAEILDSQDAFLRDLQVVLFISVLLLRIRIYLLYML